MGSVVYVYRENLNEENFLALYYLILVPLIYTASNCIITFLELRMEYTFSKKFVKSSIETSKAQYLDWFMRQISKDLKSNGRELSEHQFDQKKIKLLQFILSISFTLASDNPQEDKEGIEAQINQLQDREKIYEHIKFLLSQIYLKGKKKSKLGFSQWDISHLVFLLCIKENYPLFECTALECSNSIGKKEQQILFSLRHLLQKKINLQKYLGNGESIYESTLQQVIDYDRLIDETRVIMSEATELKVDILYIMKQKYIDLLEMQQKLKHLLDKRRILIQNISKLVSLNTLNHELYEIYFTYLESLAFSERDIQLKRYKNYLNNNSNNTIKKFMKFSNDDDGCVIFASFKNSTHQTIKNVSHNFSKIFGINTKDILQKPISVLMTTPYAKAHPKYIKNFLDKNQVVSNLRNIVAFAVVQNEYIIPVQLDIKINFSINKNLSSELGIAVFLKQINKDRFYILFDTNTTRIVSMTENAHEQLFSAIEDFRKINLVSFFPIIQKQISSQVMKSQKKKQNNSLISWKTSMMSLNTTQHSGENQNDQRQTFKQLNSIYIQNQKTLLQGNTIQQDYNTDQIKDFKNEQTIEEQFQQQNLLQQAQQMNDKQQTLEGVNFKGGEEVFSILNQANKQQIPIFEEELQQQQQFSDLQSKPGTNKLLVNEKKSQYSQKQDRLSNQNLSQKTKKTESVIGVQYLFLSLNEMNYKKKKKGQQVKSTRNKDKNSEQERTHIEKYNFFTMNLSILAVESQGLTHLKYIEILNVQQINPFLQATFIMNVYKNPLQSEFQSNITHIKKASLRILISEFEAIIKEQSLHSNEMIGLNKYEQNINQYVEEDEYQEDNEHEMDTNTKKEIDNSDKQLDNSEKENDQLLNSQQNHSKQHNNHLQSRIKNDSFQNTYQTSNLTFQKQPSSQQQAIFSNITQPMDISKNNSQMILLNNPKIAVPLYDLNNSQQDQNNQEFNELNDLTQAKIQQEKANEITTSMIIDPYQVNLQHIQNNQFDYQNIGDDNINYYYQNGHFNDNNQPSPQHVKQIYYQNDSIMDQVREDQPQAPRGQISNYTNNNMKQDNFRDQIDASVMSGQYLGTQIQSPNAKSNKQIPMSPHEGLLSPYATNHLIFSQKGTHNNTTNNLLSPTQSTQLMSPFNNKLQSILQQQTKNINKKQPKQQVSKTQNLTVTLKQTQAFVNQLTKKDHNNLQDALDSSSNHSKNSSTQSDRKIVGNMILSTKRLGIMNLVNVFGLLSLLVIVIVVLQQYFDMVFRFDDFSGDMDVVGWPTEYMNTLSLIVKNVNLQKLLKANDLYIKSGKTVSHQMLTQSQEEIVYAINQIKNLTHEMEIASPDRQIFNKINAATNLFRFGANFNFSKPLNQQPANTYFQLFDQEMGLQYSLLLLQSYIFRFGYGLGLGSGQFITLSNKQIIDKGLLEISNVSLSEMYTQLDSISSNLTNVLIILLVVIFCCVFITIPIYLMIQLKKQQLLSLFGTFNSNSIQKEISTIYNIYVNDNYDQIHNQQAKPSQKQYNGGSGSIDNEKRQNLSSTSNLKKFNIKIIILSVFIFCISLPYPIINEVLCTNFINESKTVLQMLCNQN